MARRALRSFSEGGLTASESSAFLSGCPARERGELHLSLMSGLGTVEAKGELVMCATCPQTWKRAFVVVTDHKLRVRHPKTEAK
jgi:hypothetical protein